MLDTKIEPVEAVEAESLESWDSSYCCCGSVPVKQGTFIIGILTALLILYSLFIVSINLELSSICNSAQVILLVIDLLAVILLIVGVITEKNRCLLPYLIYSFHTILLLIFGVGLGVYCWIWPTKAREWFPMDVLFEKSDWRTPSLYDEEKAIRLAAVFITVTCLFTLVIAVWWTWVAFKCYRFLRRTNRLRFYLNQWENKKYMALQLDK